MLVGLFSLRIHSAAYISIQPALYSATINTPLLMWSIVC